MFQIDPRALAVRLLACAATALAADAIAADTMPAAETDTLWVIEQPAEVGLATRLVAPGDDLTATLRRSPFGLIRRGAGSVSDLYADGLKRGAFTVTIDGERHTTACPNRMDTRVGQVNLLDVELVELDRTGGALQAGLGGRVAFRRRPPSEAMQWRGLVSGAFDHVEEREVTLSAEMSRVRASVRYRQGDPWTDADGQGFTDLYGYADEPTSEIIEIQAAHAYGGGDAVVGYESSTDVPFPYLKMDERENDHYQASASWRGHRLSGPAHGRRAGLPELRRHRRPAGGRQPELDIEVRGYRRGLELGRGHRRPAPARRDQTPYADAGGALAMGGPGRHAAHVSPAGLRRKQSA